LDETAICTPHADTVFVVAELCNVLNGTTNINTTVLVMYWRNTIHVSWLYVKCTALVAKSRSKLVTRNWVPLMASSLAMTFKLCSFKLQYVLRTWELFHPKICLLLKYFVLHTSVQYDDLNELCWNITHCKCLEIFSWWLLTLDDLKQNTVKCKYEGWNFNSGNYLFTTDTK